MSERCAQMPLPQQGMPHRARRRRPKRHRWRTAANAAGQTATTVPEAYKREANFLRQCLQFPHLLLQVNQKLLAQRQQAVRASDFAVAEDRQLLALLYERADQAAVVTVEELCDSLDDVLADRIQRLMMLPVTPEAQLANLPRSLALSILDWRRPRRTTQTAQLQQLLSERRSPPRREGRAGAAWRRGWWN